MKTPVIIAAFLALLMLTACSTIDSRVRGDQAAFDSWPADVQGKIRKGEVAVGFTADQVRMALGKPDRLVTRISERGDSEQWIFSDRAPVFSFGLGMGTRRGSTGYGGAVGTTVGGGRYRLIVTLEGGRVVGIEQLKH